MAHALYRLGRTAYRRWPFFIVGWLVVLLAIGSFAATQSKPMSDKFTIPGIPSEQAADLQAELFPGTGSAFDQATGTLVIAAPEGHTLAEPRYATQVDALLEDMRALPQVSDTTAKTAFVSPVMAAQGQEQQMLEAAKKQGQPAEVAKANAAALSPLSEDGRIGTVTWQFDVDSPVDVEPATQEAVVDAAKAASTDGLQVEVNGSGMQSMPETGGTAELFGIAVALLVLVLTFGSLVAAGLPILTALIGVGVGTLGVTAATAFTDIGTTTPMLSTMLGLAVGIDYSLFILSRYRTELRHTDDRAEAMGLAVGRAGSAVVFAGLTVVIALCALAVVGIPFLTSMGLAAAFTVAVAVLISLTLLPAVLGVLKGKAFAGRVRKDHLVDDGEGIVNNGVRWARLIGRAPVVVALVATLALGALAIPMKDLQLALPSDSTAPTDTTQRKAADLMEEGFGPGRAGPLVLVVDAREAGNPRAAQQAFGEVTQWAAGLDDVDNAQVVAMNKGGTGAQVLITPSSGPDDEATHDLLATLRDTKGAQEEATGTTLGVTGLTAITTDVSDRLQSALVPYLAIVVGLAFILLMGVFRSILVPLTATLGFLLSVLGTLGATILIFQEGLFGWFEPGPLMSFMPILVIGIVFGLAMDYQVFLVTRMREAYVHGDTAREAVVDGFRYGARVVAAAAAIMISVFAAFMLQDDPLIQSIGFSLAAAVLFDAFVIRMTLIPATMYLLGDKAWWLPRWLDRLVPNVDVEGESLARHGVTKGDEVASSSGEEYVPQHAR